MYGSGSIDDVSRDQQEITFLGSPAEKRIRSVVLAKTVVRYRYQLRIWPLSH